MICAQRQASSLSVSLCLYDVSARSLTMPVVVKLMYALVVLGVVVQTNRLSFARLSPCFTNLMVLIIYNTYI